MGVCAMKKLFIFLLLLIPTISFADTHVAATCSQADVQAAITAAANGDTVSIPAGTCTWTATVTTTKTLIVQGAGKTSTVITSALGSGSPALQFMPAADGFIQVTGIGFVHTLNNVASLYFIQIYGKTDNSFCLGANQPTTGLRINNNSFIKGGRQIYVRGCVYGLIDNNTFTNGNISVYVQGDNNYSWARTIAPSTNASVFIENNTFTLNSSYGSGGQNQFIYHQEGGRSVTRYNNFDTTDYSNSGTVFYDSHGNQNFTGTFRGQPLVETYYNSMSAHNAAGFFDFRGGSVLIHNNALSYETGSAPYTIRLWEEETWTSGGPWSGVPQVSAWPATDQIFNSFFWGNTLNTVSLTDVTLRYSAVESAYIQKSGDHIEYWNAAPASSGGKSTFGGAAGIANNACTAASTPAACCTGSKTGSCDMTFSATGANAYYPYTIYECPHPLAKGVTYTGTCNAVAGTGGYRLIEDIATTKLLSVLGGGGGTITSSTGGINCGVTCSAAIAKDTAVTLTETPSGGYNFTTWGGDCSGTATTAAVTLSADKACTATFTKATNLSIGSGATFTLNTGASITIY
jgi:hypothetical protein